MNIKCFLIVETGETYQFLRIYSSGSDCPIHGYHDVSILIEDGKIEENGYILNDNDNLLREKYKDQFAKKCDCGYEFTDSDIRQIHKARKYTDGKGNFYNIDNAPVGAIWRAHWYEDIQEMRGVDGKSYMCRTPGGDWLIDGRASNCTRVNDDIHKCWCRHGEAPNFTVNKIGNTCAAGAGSILLRNYHGFLINGELTDC